MHSFFCYIMAVVTTALTSAELARVMIKYPTPAAVPLDRWLVLAFTTIGAALWFHNALNSRR